MELTILSLFRRFIEHHRNSSDPFEKRKPGTIRAYESKYRRLNEFLVETNQVQIRCSDFTIGTAKQYARWLFEKGKGNNHVVRVVGIVSELLDYGASEELIKYNPIAAFSMRRTPPKPPVYFTKEQMKLFETYLSPVAVKQRAADFFTLQMHTGFDYGDLKEITRENCVIHRERKYLVKKRHKNGHEAIIPLSEIAEQILEKYDYKIRPVNVTDYNQKIRMVAEDLGIKIYLTSKAARKIFMMDKLNNDGVSIEATSKMGGHKSVSTTERYYAQVNINLIHRELDKIQK